MFIDANNQIPPRGKLHLNNLGFEIQNFSSRLPYRH